MTTPEMALVLVTRPQCTRMRASPLVDRRHGLGTGEKLSQDLHLDTDGAPCSRVPRYNDIYCVVSRYHVVQALLRQAERNKRLPRVHGVQGSNLGLEFCIVTLSPTRYGYA